MDEELDIIGCVESFDTFVTQNGCTSADMAGLTLLMGTQIPAGEENPLYWNLWNHIMLDYPDTLQVYSDPSRSEEIESLAEHWEMKVRFEDIPDTIH